MYREKPFGSEPIGILRCNGFSQTDLSGENYTSLPVDTSLEIRDPNTTPHPVMQRYDVAVGTPTVSKMIDVGTQTDHPQGGGTVQQTTSRTEHDNDADDHPHNERRPVLPHLDSQAAFLGRDPTDPWERRKKIAFCIYSTVTAVLVGTQFGLLSIEDYFKGVPLAASYFAYRFFSSFIVNAMGSSTTTFDAVELFKKLKKDPDAHKRDLAVVGPFIPAVALMVFAVISTIPLAKDSTEGLFGIDGVVTQKLGLSDAARTVIQMICIAIWCVGYTAPTRLDTGYAIMRELYEDTLMSRLQPDRYIQVMLARDLKKFKTIVFDGDTDSVLKLEKITEFYAAVRLILQSQAGKHSCSLSMDTVLKITRRTLMLACLPIMAPVLQDTSERAMSELMGFLHGAIRIMLAIIATLAALIFFVRSSQLLPARMVQTFKGIYGLYLNKGCGPVVATMGAVMYTALLFTIGVGSSFGWVFEAENFRKGNSPYNLTTFSGYKYCAGGYGGGANLGFEANYTNAILDSMKKYEISAGKAVVQRSTGFYKLTDERPDDAIAADERLKKLSKGTGLASDVSPDAVRALREAALNRSRLFKPANDDSAAGSAVHVGSVNL